MQQLICFALSRKKEKKKRGDASWDYLKHWFWFSFESRGGISEMNF